MQTVVIRKRTKQGGRRMDGSKLKIGITLGNQVRLYHELIEQGNSRTELKLYLVVDPKQQKFTFKPHGKSFSEEDLKTIQSLFEQKNVHQLGQLAAIIVGSYEAYYKQPLTKEEFMKYDFVIKDNNQTE